MARESASCSSLPSPPTPCLYNSVLFYTSQAFCSNTKVVRLHAIFAHSFMCLMLVCALLKNCFPFFKKLLVISTLSLQALSWVEGNKPHKSRNKLLLFLMRYSTLKTFDEHSIMRLADFLWSLCINYELRQKDLDASI